MSTGNFERPSLPSAEIEPTQRFEKPHVLQDVTFEVRPKGANKFEYRSSSPDRKLVVLSLDSDPPVTGMIYDVEVIDDSAPDNPMGGKYTVRLYFGSGEELDGQELPLPLVENQTEQQPRKPRPLEVSPDGETLYVLSTEIPYNQEGGTRVPSRERFTHFMLDERTLRTIEKVATAVELQQPCLLEGETAASKTSSIEYLAMASNHNVIRVNLNGQTDTSELIGKFVPNDGRLEIEFSQALASEHLIGDESRAIITAAQEDGRALTLLECQKIAHNEQIEIPEWRWKDGVVPEAMRSGAWLILDEINLAEPQILERLNSVLEKDPSLFLSENGGATIGPEGDLPTHENFRIFGTMNPASYAGRSAMSPAYKDRWTSYMYVPSPGEGDYLDMMKLLVYGIQPQVTIDGTAYKEDDREPEYPQLSEIENLPIFLARLAKFQITIEEMARVGTIGRTRKEKYVFTRRGLLEMLNYAENKSLLDRSSGKRVTVADDPQRILSKAVTYYFLDKITDSDDRKKVQDQLDAIGLLSNSWL
ncbi:MAG TPA: AAA family ATPase, partial [Verrucomicrobiae bacterium]|nr:AAA family ATPase [Verrucomicrobiae bacterium]